MLSRSRKMRITVASSRMLGGVSGLHWSNRKPALTANSSSRSSLSGSSTKSIRCIFPATYAQTSKMVADMPGANWMARACWAASLGPTAAMSISQVTRNSNGPPRLSHWKKYLNSCSNGHGPGSRTCTLVTETTIAGNSCCKKVLAGSQFEAHV
jgi:hypothetical protein